MRETFPFLAVLRLLESHGWQLTRVYPPYRIFTKAGELPIWIEVHDRKVEAAYVERTKRILEPESEEG